MSRISANNAAAREAVSAEQRGPLPVMADLRNIMGASSHAQDKLDEIARLIAGHLKTDVCSVYLMRAGDVLELFATHGLNADAVHKTRLTLGEGIIGQVARHACPISVNNASENPHFAPRPETGEEAYSGFCAVPILRGRKIRGVLAIQSKENRVFPAEIVEILQTIAMILAEFIASGEIISRSEMEMEASPLKKPTQLTGLCLSPGLAIAPAVLHDAHPMVDKVIAEDIPAEKLRLKKAISGMNAVIENLLRSAGNNLNTEILDILESYRMFAGDRGWQAKIEAMIDEGLTAAAAVQRAQAEIRSRFKSMDNAVLQDKAHDIDDISNRLLSSMGGEDTANLKTRPEKFVLVARSLNSASLFEYGTDKIQAIILTGGGVSGHVPIIAKSLGIPVIGQCRDALRFLRDDDLLVVDADHGFVYIDPSDYVLDLYAARLEQQRKKQNRHKRKKNLPAVTRDGQPVSLQMNAGLAIEIPLLENCGAEGIGLFRTELSFMGRSRYPRVSEQAEFYRAIIDRAGGKPVTFRTLDIGGDKPLPYFQAPKEENPALGWRAMRIIMDRPAVLRTQVRALIMGAGGRKLRLMLPFVSDVAEIDRAKTLINMEFKRAQARGIPLPDVFELGVMIEVPAMLWQLDAVFKRVDFAAVGTNDLMQYLYAADLRSDVLQDRYDRLSPAMLNALQHIADKGRQHGIPVSVCGDMAANPLEAMVLLALGFRILSVPSGAIGEIKDMVNSLDLKKIESYIGFLLKRGGSSLRKKLIGFAKDHKISISA